MSRSILFIAGDVSGDIYTSRLAALFFERNRDSTIHAMGGQHMGRVVTATGGTWIGDTTNCSAIGLTSVLGLGLRGIELQRRLRSFVRNHRVDLVVMCDWGGFNCRQLDFLKKRGIPTLYYFPPRSWQRTGKSGLAIAPFVTRVATPFKWSAQRLGAAGCNAEWVGHPLLESAQRVSERDAVKREFDVEGHETLIALLPGSRKSEIKTLAPRMAEVVDIILRSHPAKFLVPVPEPLVELTRSCFPPSVRVVAGRAEEVLKASDAAVVKTGTATLQAAVLGVPQVTVYDFSPLGRLEWVLLWMWKKIPYIAMPNIILQRLAVPELLGLNCRPELIAAELEKLLRSEEERMAMAAAYNEVRQHLGLGLASSATERTVEIMEELMQESVLEDTTLPVVLCPNESNLRKQLPIMPKQNSSFSGN